jgi:prepilin-type N-terminal cleavage/methylation domain-containing protein
MKSFWHHQRRSFVTVALQPGPARRAFTLVELMTVLVIVALLSSLTLAGLATARQRGKIDKTRSTIRKLHEIVVPHYESYVRRRVPSANPTARLRAIRTLVMREMPDSWGDVFSTTPQAVINSANIDAYLKTGPVLAYAAAKQAAGMHPNFSRYGSSECLYMIVSRGGTEPDVMGQFRADEIGDIDGDGAPEFQDGWGRPIAFFRWATGYVGDLSSVQVDDPVNRHDPFDPMRREPAAFALVPLIYSAGPDESRNDPLTSAASGYGLARISEWNAIDMAAIFAAVNGDGQRPGASEVSNPRAYLDNITNHDLNTK